MTGDVVLPDALRQRVTGSDGVTYEYITIGSDVAVRTWLRDTAYPDQLDARPWAEIEGASGRARPVPAARVARRCRRPP